MYISSYHIKFKSNYSWINVALSDINSPVSFPREIQHEHLYNIKSGWFKAISVAVGSPANHTKENLSQSSSILGNMPKVSTGILL